MVLSETTDNGHVPEALHLEPVRFTDRAGLFTPLGDSGLTRYGGYVDDPWRRLTGARWQREVRAMLDTPVIRGMVVAVEMLIRRAEWQMTPAESQEELPVEAEGKEAAAARRAAAPSRTVGVEAQEVADFVESCRFDMRTPWEDTLAEILSFLPYGYSLHEIVLKRRLGDEGNPSSAADDGLIGWDEWSPRPQDTLVEWIFDDRGHVVGFVQQGQNLAQRITIPLSRCLHFRAGGYRGSPEGESVLRAAYVDWDAINKLQRIEAIGIERDLAGLPFAGLPSEYLGGNRTPQQDAVFQAVKKIVTGVRNNDQAGVIFPLEYDDKGHPRFEFKLVSTGGSRQFDTGSVISRRATYMTMTLLADFLMVGHGQTGSYALSQDKTRLFTTAISAWIDVIANVINKQAIAPLVKINGIDPRLTPILRPGALDDTDLKATSEYFKALMPLIQRLSPEDQLALGRHLFDLADWPAINTTAEDLAADTQDADKGSGDTEQDGKDQGRPVASPPGPQDTAEEVVP